MKLVVFLSTAPLLARAAPWSDDCKGLSRLAFIVVVVESVVLFLFFVLSLSLCRTVQHQKRRIYAAPRVHVQQSVRHSADTVPADMHDDDTDQAAYLLAPRVPNTLRPGSVSSRSTLLSPALYAYTPSTEHTDLDAHKKDTLAAPTQHNILLSTTTLPNPHSADHSHDDNSAPPPSPSIYSQPTISRSTGSWATEPTDFLSRGSTFLSRATSAPRPSRRTSLHSGPATHHPELVVPSPQTQNVSDSPELGDTGDLESFILLSANVHQGQT